jgi:hypothetical protein
MNYIAHITHNGISRRYALIAMDRDDARREALLLARSMFRQFTYAVRQA